ncbi:MAG: glycoside hydrolase family 3 C-terminal domain-containing protein [Clostridia bacterium]|nr:glycoside hydrolase family 3 C-terminal domain-containing protein [Clostridia bacterium]
MNKRTDEILKALTLEEKISLLTGAGSMATAEVGRLELNAKKFADGPHGVRKAFEENCTSFPNLCLVGATWDTELIHKMGVALAKDCIEHDVDMLLGPGVNIKRHILCGRNFEYLSEDPVLAGELAAAYINGLQSLGVGASLKHYAANNQEKYRITVNVDADLRTLMEIYLRAFEIAVKKSSPASVMCAYNKIYSIWCSENKFLLTEVLRDMWHYDGFVVSDWGAVHDAPKSFAAGLDMQMPQNPTLLDEMKQGLEKGTITMEEIDAAVRRMIDFIKKPVQEKGAYNRQEQHNLAREIAAGGIVLLKNEKEVLPITPQKYKKIAVIGEFAKDPLINGQGSAEVRVQKEWIESPYDELKKILDGDVELAYQEVYKKAEFSREMLWPKKGVFNQFIADCDMVLMFVGAMESEDTENFDRRTAELNPNYEMFIEEAVNSGKPVAVVIQSGSAMILGDWHKKVSTTIEMWLGGESAGGAIADVLCGKVNPSGRLPETFPAKMRTDLVYPGDEHAVSYHENLLVGYRYYDLHPEEIVYPFGHGLSYTEFTYSDVKLVQKGDKITVAFDLKNVGKVKGAEVVELYVGDPVSTVVRPVKELKAFRKVMLDAGETQRVELEVAIRDMGYYNVALRDWVTEPGEYIFYLGASSQDIRHKESIILNTDAPYTIDHYTESMIG